MTAWPSVEAHSSRSTLHDARPPHTCGNRECIALLRRRARELRIDVSELTLRVVVKRRWRTYRA